jgi:hypothetical protein
MSALIQLNIAELLRGVKNRQQARTSAASSESPFAHARSTTPFGFKLDRQRLFAFVALRQED